MQQIGRYLIAAGLLLAAAGVILTLIGRVPFIGRLPGDIYVERKNFHFYFPVATSLLISLVLSLIIWLFSRR